MEETWGASLRAIPEAQIELAQWPKWWKCLGKNAANMWLLWWVLMVLVSGCCFFQSFNGVDLQFWQVKMIKMSKTGRSCPGFLSVENFLSYYNPQLANSHCFGGMLFVSCVFLIESDRIDRTHRRWWQPIFLFFTPNFGEDEPIWRTYFWWVAEQPPSSICLQHKWLPWAYWQILFCIFPAVNLHEESSFVFFFEECIP